MTTIVPNSMHTHYKLKPSQNFAIIEIPDNFKNTLSLILPDNGQDEIYIKFKKNCDNPTIIKIFDGQEEPSFSRNFSVKYVATKKKHNIEWINTGFIFEAPATLQSNNTNIIANGNEHTIIITNQNKITITLVDPIITQIDKICIIDKSNAVRDANNPIIIKNVGQVYGNVTIYANFNNNQWFI